MNTERFNADERGVSEIVGAILVFALVVMLISIMQTVAVPNQNQEIEVQHSVDVQGDMAKYHQVASEVATGGSEQSVAIQTGTGYPARLLFFNPPRVQGTLETKPQGPAGTAVIENIRSPDGEVNNYITDDQGGELRLKSRTMQYRGNYNEYQNPPVIKYEYGLLYNEYDDASVVANPGTLIDGTDINLLFLAGEYAQTSSTTQSVGVQPVSAPARTVPIETNGNGDLNITLQSDLPVEQWKDAYDSRYIEDITRYQNPNEVEIQLDDTQTYNLRMSRIALEKGVQNPEGYYIVPAGDGTTSVAEGGTTNVKYEVRDKYNNPVSNVEVKVTKPDGTPDTDTTNSRGRVTFEVTPQTSGTQFVSAEIDSSNSNTASPSPPSPDCPNHPRCTADFTLQVTDLSINPNSGVKLEEVTIETETVTINPPAVDGIDTPVTEKTEVIEAEFNSTSGTKEVEELRVNVYAAAQQENEEPAPDQVQIENTDPESVALTGVNVSGPFYTQGDDEWVNGPRPIKQASNEKYQFAFIQDGSPRAAESGDFFVLTVIFDKGEQAVYFVSPD